MRVPISTIFKRAQLWLGQIFAILLPAMPRRNRRPSMGLPPFENPNRKTRVSRGTQMWEGIKRKKRISALWLQRSYVGILWVIGICIFGSMASLYLRQIVISLRWMIDHLVLITAMAPGVVEGSMDPTKDLAVKTVDIRNLSYGIAVLLGVLAAAATLPFTMIRVWFNERNTQATEQGLITDRINTAVAGLGTEKPSKTAPVMAQFANTPPQT